MANASEGSILVSVGNLPGYFTTCTGGEVTLDTSTVTNGGDDFETTIPGQKKIGQLTVTRPFDTERDSAICRDLKRLMPKYRATVSKQIISADGVIREKPIVYPNALLISVTEPDANWGSSNAAMMELKFAVDRTT